MSDTLRRIRVIDFETTGFPPNGKAVEIGWTDVTEYPDGWAIDADPHSMLIDPGIPIPPDASAIHNITDDMVTGAISPLQANETVFDRNSIYCAHNVEFDRKFSPSTAKNWICTLKCARALYPDFEKHTNQYLRYALQLNVDDSRANPPHRAGGDSFVTAHILVDFLKLRTAEQLLEMSSGASLLLRMPMGKHRGKQFNEIPADYLHWITGSDMPGEIKESARAELRRRGANG